MAGQKLNIGTRHLHVCVSPQGPFAQPPNGLTSPSTNTIQLTLFSFSSLPLTKPRGAGGAINCGSIGSFFSRYCTDGARVSWSSTKESLDKKFKIWKITNNRVTWNTKIWRSHITSYFVVILNMHPIFYSLSRFISRSGSVAPSSHSSLVMNKRECGSSSTKTVILEFKIWKHTAPALPRNWWSLTMETPVPS